ncbi:junctional protein associated with coronary artery disease isoform X1 [Lynx canadensis]|uniref:Junctional cadherin 5 associated n=2 Tax=Lynx canadensis TaxID=61383 RepID=A0A667GJP4_LYNCA|nr:junctional protein associated with coronary artery disease isoform X1 [Lynx canadensis]XP_030177093.1 junctional protein associated with coronary artery disease isoform X1 [Lynx canadensis]XP_030177094.1 junctional protein associated with coronary artery disease isoform X1 [Lynx canadensis]
MYSVEDLLISHGYKLSRGIPAPHDGDREGRRHARPRARAGQGLLNGCEDGPAGPPPSKPSPGKGHVSASEDSHHLRRALGEPQSASASRAREAGFYHQPVLRWSSQPQTARDHAYWRRKGQEVGGLLGPRAREDPEVRGMAQAHSLPVHMREGPWEVGGRTENVMKKAVWEEELRMAGPAKWQNISLESWNQPRKLGRQMSDGDGERLFQDLYPFVQGEHVLNSQSKGKSQSLPRVLSPEGLSCMEIPIPLNDGHFPGVPKMPFYPPNCAPNLESKRNPEKGGSSVPFPRPKFGRPLKPPPYDSHQHSRAGVEASDSLDSQQADLCVSYLTKSSEPRLELCAPDSSLEPPVYVPPPSYRSPPQHIANPYVEDTVPGPVCGPRQQQHPLEPAGPPGTGNEYGVSPHSPRGVPQQPRPTTAYDGSVLYIPFDDPRIRHFKLARPRGFCQETTANEKSYNSSPSTAPAPAHGNGQHDGAVLSPQRVRTSPGGVSGPAAAEPSPWWLWDQLPRDAENGAPDQRAHGAVGGQWPALDGGRGGHTEGLVSPPSPQGESTCETRTKLKKFETGIRTKKSSKKKMNETVFCLVSIPVKSESHLPDMDTNNNDLKQGTDKRNGLDKSAALQEQSLLSMSSTDLELQALTGSMVGRTEFQKQDLGEPEEGKQTNDLRFIHPAQHRELKYSGSWPGHQYRDQQTQTTFAEEARSALPLPGQKPGGSPKAVLTPKYSDPLVSEAHAPTALAPGDRNQRPSAHHPKGQMSLSPSSNSAFSRTSSCVSQAPVSKAGPSQACAEGRGRRASPVPRGDVVKGETTGPCNSKQLFGQFLLKPVSRRPWDLISQLESFNKELQEEEESSPSGSDGDSSSEDSDTEWQPEGRAEATGKHWGCGGDGQAWKVEEPGARPGRAKSKSESWSEGQKPGWPGTRAQCPGPTEVEGGRGAAVAAHGGLIADEGNQEVERALNTEPAVSPGPVKRAASSRSGDTKPVPSSDPASLRQPPGSQALPRVPISAELSPATPRKAGGEEGRSLPVPLALASKPRGLSAPDLRSVGLTRAQEQSAGKSDASSGEASAIEIPPNESLQARAARILGIEVAVESLLPGTRRTGQDQHPEPDGGGRGPEAPREEPGSGSQLDDPAASPDAFYGRRKCGWTQSPLFVGERDSARRAALAAEPSGADGTVPSKAPSPEPQYSPQESRSFNPKDMGTKPPFKSTLFHFIERTPNMPGSEKRLRSTSKVIESLQEKLASPPRRADPSRLMRMKEVSSVSRMRLLTSRSADSTEEAEEPKAERDPGMQPGGPVSLNAGDLARKAGLPLVVSKGALPPEEDGRPMAHGEKKTVHQDFWCPDSYDPSRVERV